MLHVDELFRRVNVSSGYGQQYLYWCLENTRAQGIWSWKAKAPGTEHMVPIEKTTGRMYAWWFRAEAEIFNQYAVT